MIKHIQTEKTSLLEEKGFYTFLVDEDLNRIQVKGLFEDKFKVEIISVNTMIAPPKNKSYRAKRVSPLPGRTARWKKAVVKVADGQYLDLYSNES